VEWFLEKKGYGELRKVKRSARCKPRDPAAVHGDAALRGAARAALESDRVDDQGSLFEESLLCRGEIMRGRAASYINVARLCVASDNPSTPGNALQVLSFGMHGRCP